VVEDAEVRSIDEVVATEVDSELYSSWETVMPRSNGEAAVADADGGWVQ
jgi:hypothetical protein